MDSAARLKDRIRYLDDLLWGLQFPRRPFCVDAYCRAWTALDQHTGILCVGDGDSIHPAHTETNSSERLRNSDQKAKALIISAPQC